MGSSFPALLFDLQIQCRFLQQSLLLYLSLGLVERALSPSNFQVCFQPNGYDICHADFVLHCNVAKNARTAIGYSTKEISLYMTPDYVRTADHGGYVSMGGAGYIYPLRLSAARGYSEGDEVKVSKRICRSINLL